MLYRLKVFITMHRILIATQDYIYNVIAAALIIIKNLAIMIHVEVILYNIIVYFVQCHLSKLNSFLPFQLSKECRKEMQYYKLLAKEVEKRISLLKPYVLDSDTDSSEDKTDAPELPESEQSYELPPEQIQAGFNVNIDKITAVTQETAVENVCVKSPRLYSPDLYENVASNITNHHVTMTNTITTPSVTNSPKKFVIDLSLSINESGRNVLETIKNNSRCSPPPVELPERDYDCPKNIVQKEILTDVETVGKKGKQSNIVEDIVNFSFSIDKDVLSNPFPDLPIKPEGPSSLSSKSFTGSLIDIHTESIKESQMSTKLVRQSSYTLLQPSPQLLAHLEVQSMNTGIDMNCISMSESLSNLSSPNKKRRSWDLESAKVKWSSMALELNQKNVTNTAKINGANKTVAGKPTPKKTQQRSPSRSRSVAQEKPRTARVPAKVPPKSEPIQRPNKKSLSPVRNIPSTRAVSKEPVVAKTSNVSNQIKEPSSPKPVTQLISESEDPAARVRELYEKIQKQQLIQMASLVDKQKKEQLLLQQVFEEQNNLLYKQLKTICPKSPIEVKEAWGDKVTESPDRGPVSLSQLINHKSSDNSGYNSPVSTTLAETNNYISHCDDVLKRSKDITSTIKRQPTNSAGRSQSVNGAKTASPRSKTDGSRTRTQSPVNRTASRRLDYDASASSFDEPMLTDRTNDTMADLNVTFPSDHSDECYPFVHNGNASQCKEVTVVHRSPMPTSSGIHTRPADNAVRKSGDSSVSSFSVASRRPVKQYISQPTPEQVSKKSCSLFHTMDTTFEIHKSSLYILSACTNIHCFILPLLFTNVYNVLYLFILCLIIVILHKDNSCILLFLFFPLVFFP